MSDLLEQIEKVKNFGRAIQNGLEKAIEAFPHLARQQIYTKAKRKLHSTMENYMDAVKTSNDGYVFIVELDADNWLANATESGVSPFDMKEGLLNSKKAKKSKDGSRYLRIPMAKDPNRKADTMGTEKSQEYQRLIEHVMRKPKFGPSQLKHTSDGSLVEQQKLMTDEPQLQGYYRVRKLESAKQFYSGKTQGIPFQHIMFRTISDKKSKTGATWEHPGIKGVNIFKELERELPQIFETILEKAIEDEIEQLF